MKRLAFLLMMIGVGACAQADPDATSSTALGTAPTTVTVASTPPAGSTTTSLPAADTLVPDTTTPSTTASDGTAAAPSTPEGFELVEAAIVDRNGERCELCLWIADNNELRRRGLMNVESLGAGDGMAFVYDRPHTGSFWMKNTLLPITISFFDQAGNYLKSTDMEPCTEDPCPTYPTATDFLVAIEFEQGTAADYGVGPGAVLELSNIGCGAAGRA